MIEKYYYISESELESISDIAVANVAIPPRMAIRILRIGLLITSPPYGTNYIIYFE